MSTAVAAASNAERGLARLGVEAPAVFDRQLHPRLVNQAELARHVPELHDPDVALLGLLTYTSCPSACYRDDLIKEKGPF